MILQSDVMLDFLEKTGNIDHQILVKEIRYLRAAMKVSMNEQLALHMHVILMDALEGNWKENNND